MALQKSMGQVVGVKTPLLKEEPDQLLVQPGDRVVFVEQGKTFLVRDVVSPMPAREAKNLFETPQFPDPLTHKQEDVVEEEEMSASASADAAGLVEEASLSEFPETRTATEDSRPLTSAPLGVEPFARLIEDQDGNERLSVAGQMVHDSHLDHWVIVRFVEHINAMHQVAIERAVKEEREFANEQLTRAYDIEKDRDALRVQLDEVNQKLSESTSWQVLCDSLHGKLVESARTIDALRAEVKQALPLQGTEPFAVAICGENQGAESGHVYLARLHAKFGGLGPFHPQAAQECAEAINATFKASVEKAVRASLAETEKECEELRTQLTQLNDGSLAVEPFAVLDKFREDDSGWWCTIGGERFCMRHGFQYRASDLVDTINGAYQAGLAKAVKEERDLRMAIDRDRDKLFHELFLQSLRANEAESLLTQALKMGREQCEYLENKAFFFKATRDDVWASRDSLRAEQEEILKLGLVGHTTALEVAKYLNSETHRLFAELSRVSRERDVLTKVREETLEECALRCEAISKACATNWGTAAAFDCAEEIRKLGRKASLKEPSELEEKARKWDELQEVLQVLKLDDRFKTGGYIVDRPVGSWKSECTFEGAKREVPVVTCTKREPPPLGSVLWRVSIGSHLIRFFDEETEAEDLALHINQALAAWSET